MTGINRIALEAAHKINDIFVQAHHSEAQRTARIQIVVRDAIAATQEKADMDWLPIESSPKDRTAILVIKAGSHKGVSFRPVVASWFPSWEDQGCEGPWEIVENDVYWNDEVWEQTHWMPLPEPPQDKADEASK